jgi:hypothetical protein
LFYQPFAAMSTPATESSLGNGAIRLSAGVYLVASGLYEIVAATYNATAPVVVAAVSTAGQVTSTYVVPAVYSAGATAMTFVKGKPAAPTAEAFDLTEHEEDDFTVINNGTELTDPTTLSASVPF